MTIIGRTLQIERPKKGGRLLSSINIFFATTNQEEKCPNQKNLTFCQLSSAKGLCERILTLSAAETAATEDSDTQSEDDDVSVSEDSESEDD